MVATLVVVVFACVEFYDLYTDNKTIAKIPTTSESANKIIIFRRFFFVFCNYNVFLKDVFDYKIKKAKNYKKTSI